MGLRKPRKEQNEGPTPGKLPAFKQSTGEGSMTQVREQISSAANKMKSLRALTGRVSPMDGLQANMLAVVATLVSKELGEDSNLTPAFQSKKAAGNIKATS